VSTQRPSWRIVGPADRRVVPWANGRGTTAVVARVPDTDDWTWRLSLADVVEDGPFSSLPGVDRWIAVARGGRMALQCGAPDGFMSTVLDETHGAVSFSGDGDTTCRVLDGPLVDVNLMLRRGRATGALDLYELDAGERWSGTASAVVVLSGRVELVAVDDGGADNGGADGVVLDGATFDAAVIDGERDALVSLVADGPARLAVVVVDARGA
jgi:environmental stress-induced protein Ves